MSYSQRIGRDIGQDGVFAWLQARAEQERRHVRIKVFDLDCQSTVELSRRDKGRLYRLQSGNQSELHAYLKFVAVCWLEKQGSEEGRVFSERKYYTPGLEAGLTIILDTQGKRFDLTKCRFLPKWSSFPLNYGRLFRFDLASSRTVIEVGATQADNLLRPLLDDTIKRAIWIPFPNEHNSHDFTVRKHELSAVKAYEISLVPLRKRRSRGLIVRSINGRVRII